jgi:hypothetical protein
LKEQACVCKSENQNSKLRASQQKLFMVKKSLFKLFPFFLKTVFELERASLRVQV